MQKEVVKEAMTFLEFPPTTASGHITRFVETKYASIMKGEACLS